VPGGDAAAKLKIACCLPASILLTTWNQNNLSHPERDAERERDRDIEIERERERE
jgi:hypothetical protein